MTISSGRTSAPAPSARALGQVAAKGFAWLTVQSLLSRVTLLTGQVVLAWLLSPRDFGLIGLAYTITSVANLIVNPGIDDVLVQRQRHLHLWLTPAFWLGLALGMAGGTLMLVAAPFGATLYNAPELSGMIRILAIAAPVGALSLIANVVIRTSLQFRLLASLNLAELLTSQTLTVLFAWFGFGPYSFVLPVPITIALRTALAWAITRPPVRFRPEARRWRFLLGDSSAVFIYRLLTTAVGQGDYMILGLFASPTVVGGYYFAYNVAVQSTRIVTGNMANVLLPALSRLASDPDRQAAATLETSRLFAVIIIPLCLLQAGLAAPVIHAFFGEKWTEAIPLVQILSVGLGFDAVSWVAGALLPARGEFQRALLLYSRLMPVFFVLVAIGGWLSLAMGVAVGVTLYYILIAPLYVYFVLREHRTGWGSIAKLFLLPATVGTGSIAAAHVAAGTLLATAGGDWWRILIIAVVSGALYVSASYWLMPDVWIRLRGLLGPLLRR